MFHMADNQSQEENDYTLRNNSVVFENDMRVGHASGDMKGCIWWSEKYEGAREMSAAGR